MMGLILSVILVVRGDGCELSSTSASFRSKTSGVSYKTPIILKAPAARPLGDISPDTVCGADDLLSDSRL